MPLCAARAASAATPSCPTVHSPYTRRPGLIGFLYTVRFQRFLPAFQSLAHSRGSAKARMKPGQSAGVPLLTCPRKVCPFLPGIWENRRQMEKKNQIPPEKSHCQTTTITPHTPKHNNKIPLVWQSPNCFYTGT